MQGPVGLLNVITIPPGAGLGQRIVLDGFRGAMFEYDVSNNLVSSWAATAGTDPYGHAYPAGFSIGIGSSFSGTDFFLNSSGFFVYSGTPALGNLIGSWAAAAGTDSFGNAYPAGINVTVGTISGSTISGSTFNGTNFVINTSGRFVYSSTPAAGNLIISESSAGGTDAFGNVYLAGLVIYWKVGAVYFATQHLVGIRFYTATSEAGPWGSSFAGINVDTSSDMLPTASNSILMTGGLSLATQTKLNVTAGGSVTTVDGRDGQTYSTEIEHLHMATGTPTSQSITSTTPAVVGSNGTNTPITATVGAIKYRVYAHAICTQGTVAAVQDFSFLGTATVGSMRVDGHSNQNGANPGLGNSTTQTGKISTAPFAIGAAFQMTIQGWVTFSAGGTFSLAAANDVATDTFTIVDAYMALYPVG